MTDLVERLRDLGWVHDRALREEAAAALEAQAKELEALRLLARGQDTPAFIAWEKEKARAETAERDRDEAREAQYLLDWFSKHPKLELSFGGWDEDHDAEWSVHSVGGSRNDREWTLLANRSTPLEAIRAARAITGKD